MTFSVKVFFTIIGLLWCVCICAVDPKRDFAGPDRMWSLGKRDPVRMLLFRANGTPRRYTKVGLITGTAAFIAVVWFA